MHASMGVVRPHCQPLTYSHLSMNSFVDHVDHTVPSAPRLERPGDGEDATVESQMERSGKLDWFGCAAALPPTGDKRKNRG